MTLLGSAKRNGAMPISRQVALTKQQTLSAIAAAEGTVADSSPADHDYADERGGCNCYANTTDGNNVDSMGYAVVDIDTDMYT